MVSLYLASPRREGAFFSKPPQQTAIKLLNFGAYKWHLTIVLIFIALVRNKVGNVSIWPRAVCILIL